MLIEDETCDEFIVDDEEEEIEEEDLPMATNEQPSESVSSGSQPVSSDQCLAARETSPLRDLTEELIAFHVSVASSTPEEGQPVTARILESARDTASDTVRP